MELLPLWKNIGRQAHLSNMTLNTVPLSLEYKLLLCAFVVVFISRVEISGNVEVYQGEIPVLSDDGAEWNIRIFLRLRCVFVCSRAFLTLLDSAHV